MRRTSIPGRALLAGLALLVGACAAPVDDGPSAGPTAPPVTAPEPLLPTTTTASPFTPPAQTAFLEWDGPLSLRGAAPIGWRSIAVGERGVVGVGADDDAGRIVLSLDGISWREAATLADARISGLTAGGPGYVAVGTRTTEEGAEVPAVWTSPDGRVWTPAALPDGEEGPGSAAGGSLLDVAAGAGELVAVGRDAAGRSVVWTSPDGITWSRAPGSPFGASTAVVRDVAAGPAGLVAWGLTPPDELGRCPLEVFWSADGLAWESRFTIVAEHGSGPLVADVVAFGDGFALAGVDIAGGPAVWTSPDGRTWRGPTVLPAMGEPSWGSLTALATDGDLLVATGMVFDTAPGAAVWLSEDGRRWELVPPAELRGDLGPDSMHASAAIRLADRWLVYGGTSSPAGTGPPLAWVGPLSAVDDA